MEGIGKFWIGRDRLPVFFDGLLVMAFENQVQRGVVVMLGLLAGRFAGNLGAGARWILGHG